MFDLVRYPAGPGLMAAYLTPRPKDGRLHPAIVWITGGDSNSIDDLWHAAPASNDQTAAAYEELIPRMRRKERDIMSCLSAQEREDFARALGKIEISLGLVQTSWQKDQADAY